MLATPTLRPRYGLVRAPVPPAVTRPKVSRSGWLRSVVVVVDVVLVVEVFPRPRTGASSDSRATSRSATATPRVCRDTRATRRSGVLETLIHSAVAPSLVATACACPDRVWIRIRAVLRSARAFHSIRALSSFEEGQRETCGPAEKATVVTAATTPARSTRCEGMLMPRWHSTSYAERISGR